MKAKNRWITFLLLVAIAVVIALVVIHFEISTYGKETVLLVHFMSDGFFAAAVLYLSCGILTFISEAGNFYGIQYLGYTLVYLFSFKKSYEEKKDYFSYCIEKKEKQKKNTFVKWVFILIGLVCLSVSAISAVLYYQIYSH